MKTKLRLPQITFTRIMQLVGLLIALLLTGLALYLFVNYQRVEPALKYKRDLPAFAQVSADDLETIYVPVNRKFDVVGSNALAVGQWTVHPVSIGEMVHESQLTPDPPDRFRFTASGAPLPEDLWAYFIAVPGQVMNVVVPGNDLTLSLTDPLTEQMIVVLDKADILDKVEDGIFLGLTMDQIAAIERLKLEQSKAEKDEGQPGGSLLPELVWAVTQGANPDLPPLAVFKMELTAASLGGE